MQTLTSKKKCNKSERKCNSRGYSERNSICNLCMESEKVNEEVKRDQFWWIVFTVISSFEVVKSKFNPNLFILTQQ